MRIVKEELVRSVKKDLMRGRTEECWDQMMSRQLWNVAYLCGYLKGLRDDAAEDTRQPIYVVIGTVIDALEEILYEKSADWVKAQVRRNTSTQNIIAHLKSLFKKRREQ